MNREHPEDAGAEEPHPEVAGDGETGPGATGDGEPAGTEPPYLGDAVAVRRGMVRLSRRLRQERPDASLSANQIGVLSHLGRHGPATPGEVAAAERQRPQSLTRAFAELEAGGLIARARDSADRRQSVLSITPAGRIALAQDTAHRDGWLAAALGTLTGTECEVLRLAGALMERLSRAELPTQGHEPAPDAPEPPRTPRARGPQPRQGLPSGSRAPRDEGP